MAILIFFISLDLKKQEEFGINILCCLFHHIYEETLTADKYIEIFKNQLEDFMDSVPVRALNEMYFHQDSAPDHNERINANYLNYRCPYQFSDLFPLKILFIKLEVEVLENDVKIPNLRSEKFPLLAISTQ